MKLTHAIVLAAGLGTRMRPLTHTLPKPLIKVAGKPLIDWCLDWLVEGGIKNVVVNASYLADQIETHLASRKVIISREEPKPLETGGGIAHALHQLGTQPFLSMNGDAILPAQKIHPVARLQQAWTTELDFLMLLVSRESAIGWSGNGDFIVNEKGDIRRPRQGEEAPYIFTGVEIIHPRAFEGCPQGAFSLGILWRQREGEGGWYKHIRAVVHDGPWINVGDLKGLKQAEAYFKNSEFRVQSSGN